MSFQIIKTDSDLRKGIAETTKVGLSQSSGSESLPAHLQKYISGPIDEEEERRERKRAKKESKMKQRFGFQSKIIDESSTDDIPNVWSRDFIHTRIESIAMKGSRNEGTTETGPVYNFGQVEEKPLLVLPDGTTPVHPDDVIYAAKSGSQTSKAKSRSITDSMESKLDEIHEIKKRKRSRWGDPVTKEEPTLVSTTIGSNLEYTLKSRWIGQPPPNRFDIQPGPLWDGIDRSNGFENQVFAKRNEDEVKKAERHAWSVEDM